jgi:glycosyltransferase Alg8
MSSMGLSRRVLTLTGRMSMFRASLACDPSFIRQIELDWIDHWRLGRFKFLTGDDKSTWFWLLRHGHHMIYVHDVVVTTVEEPPTPRFIDSAAQLMTRWFGNMLRTNTRALALSPRRIGLFTWWSILDQRLSMWTSLAGLVMVLLVGLFVTPVAFLFYFVWILASRYVMTLMLLGARRRVSVLYPPLLYFNQIFGACIKTYVLFRLHRQKWTRQKTVLENRTGRLRLVFGDVLSPVFHGFSIIFFVTLTALAVDILPWPQYWSIFDRL